jgi:acyl-CoA reductase-like NAD-dependent aldehyde dehydrogenase
MMNSFDIISPSTNEILAHRDYSDSNAIETTLAKATSAFKEWRHTSIAHRAEICLKMVQYFQNNVELFSEEITMQMGRPIQYSPFEIKVGLKERAEYMINIAADSLADQKVSEVDGFERFIRKEALGTVLVLAPWNYPYLTSVNAIIPSLMAGNTVILKHATQTALCAERYLEAFQAAGLPDGVFQILHLDHNQVAQTINDERIAYTAFTGSVEGGKAIQKAVGTRFISSGLELGGKDPAYVCSDADLGSSIENLVDGSFFNSGQSCCGIERIYVQEDVFDEFVDGFVNLTKKYVLGDPLNSATTLGPMVRIKNAQLVIDQIESAVANGAKELINRDDFPVMPLPYLAPQVLINVNNNMDIMKEETFGPVVGIMPVRSDAQAIKLMNDSRYGLTASIWTNDLDKALQIGDNVETGTWFMNRCDYLDPELAWTGVKDSGKGCTLSSLGYDYVTRPKSFHLKLK